MDATLGRKKHWENPPFDAVGWRYSCGNRKSKEGISWAAKTSGKNPRARNPSLSQLPLANSHVGFYPVFMRQAVRPAAGAHLYTSPDHNGCKE